MHALLDEKRSEARRRAERCVTELGIDLEADIDRAEELPVPADEISPVPRLTATELELVCTYGMLLAVLSAQRLAYVLCEVMDLEGADAAHVAGVTPAAIRQQPRIRRLRGAAQLFRAHPEYAVDSQRVSELLGRIEATVFGSGRVGSGGAQGALRH